MTRIGILHRPHVGRAEALAESIKSYLDDRGFGTWVGSAWDEEQAAAHMKGTDLIVGIGGDGTILHCARVSAPCGVPILGVKLGQLGFITEFNENEVASLLPRVLQSEGWIEERTMLKVTWNEGESLALNDAVIRCTAVRLVDVTFEVDGEQVTTYRADGVIVASATGSTAYSLAAGGPVLMPESSDLVVQPVCSHVGLRHALVLPQTAVVTLSVQRHDGVVLSLDGQVDKDLTGGERVTIASSEYKARFLRLRPHTYFYRSLHEKLGGTYT